MITTGYGVNSSIGRKMRKKVAEWGTFGTVDCWYFIAFCHFFSAARGRLSDRFFELCKCDLLRICGENEGIAANPLHFVRLSGTGSSRILYLLSMSFLSAFS